MSFMTSLRDYLEQIDKELIGLDNETSAGNKSQFSLGKKYTLLSVQIRLQALLKNYMVERDLQLKILKDTTPDQMGNVYGIDDCLENEKNIVGPFDNIKALNKAKSTYDEWGVAINEVEKKKSSKPDGFKVHVCSKCEKPIDNVLTRNTMWKRDQADGKTYLLTCDDCLMKKKLSTPEDTAKLVKDYQTSTSAFPDFDITKITYETTKDPKVIIINSKPEYNKYNYINLYTREGMVTRQIKKISRDKPTKGKSTITLDHAPEHPATMTGTLKKKSSKSKEVTDNMEGKHE